ncbi:MAG: hypothetical protein ABFS05_00320 [Bacteroidota bacterium]
MEKTDEVNATASLKGEAQGCEVITDLMAGQNLDVGDVSVIDDGTNIYVTYEIFEPGWGMTQSHLHIADELSGIPQTPKGNPKIGKFDYQQEHNMVQKYTYIVPNSWPAGTEVVIAAHAVVEYDYMSAAAGALPGAAGLFLEYPSHVSYFTSIVTQGGILNFDNYEGWCIDAGHGIYPYKDYDVIVYSSYGDLSNLGNVDHPEHLDKVNWVLNQNFVGQQSSAYGAYTASDVQRVIWELVDDNPPTYVGNWDRVREILELAYIYGEGYVPGCDEFMAVVLEPTDNAQVTIIEVAVSELTNGCDYGEETAWASGLPFPGNSWAMYFMYTICP